MQADESSTDVVQPLPNIKERGSHRRRLWRPFHVQYDTASGVYGIVVGAAVLAVDAGLNVPTRETVESVVGVLLIYWLAEAYADLLTESTRESGLRVWFGHAGRHLIEDLPFI